MAGGTRYWSDSSNFRQKPMKTERIYERIYETIEHVRINDTMFSGEIFRSITETQTSDQRGAPEFGVEISTTVHGSGDLRKLLRELHLTAMVIVVTLPGGPQKIYRNVAIVETTMDVQVGFTARVRSVNAVTVPNDEPEEKVRPEPLQIIIDDQLMPLEHCSAVWAKNPFGSLYRTTVEVAEQYVEGSKFSMGDVATIKLRYPDVELTFLSMEGIDIDDHNTEKRMFRFTHRAKLINERRIKTQKPELF